MQRARNARPRGLSFFSPPPRLVLFVFPSFVSMMINYILPTLPDCFVRSDDNVSIFELRNTFVIRILPSLLALLSFAVPSNAFLSFICSLTHFSLLSCSMFVLYSHPLNSLESGLNPERTRKEVLIGSDCRFGPSRFFESRALCPHHSF